MIRFLSGEFLLDRRANGGTVVLGRSAWIAVWGYLAAVLLREGLDPASMPEFAADSLRNALLTNLSVAGGVFAGAYAALYARFASQWTYLAGVYNQIMAAKVRGVPAADTPALSALDAWEAGFIEDAEDLHLARKPMFAGVIISMLARDTVRQKFISATAGGVARLTALEAAVRTAYDDAEVRRVARRKKSG